MVLNMNFQQIVSLRLDEVPWVPSPGGQVDRKKLEREGEESGWATTVVRFPAGSSFPQHGHPGGEEFLVLEGVFSDETGDFGKYSYVRNGSQTVHAPFSKHGCTILVKLCQMSAEEKGQLVIADALNANLTHGLLHRDVHEEVSLRQLQVGDTLEADGVEMFVIDGTITFENQDYPGFSWLRFPQGAHKTLTCKTAATLWQKKRAIG